MGEQEIDPAARELLSWSSRPVCALRLLWWSINVLQLSGCAESRAVVVKIEGSLYVLRIDIHGD